MIIKNIGDLEFEMRAVLTELGYSEGNIKTKLNVVQRLIRLHFEQGEEQFSKDIADNYVANQETRCLNGEISRTTFLNYRTATEHLAQINDTGMIVHKHRKRLPDLPDGFERILNAVLVNDEQNINLRKTIGAFFRWLYFRGHSNLNSVDEHIVREYLTECSERMVGASLNNVRSLF